MAVNGFVLAGGRSRRMGVDKARLPFPGRWPMAVHVAGVLAEVCDRVALVRRGAPDGLPWPLPDGGALEVIRDADGAGDPHPLFGVAAACAASRTPWLLVVPCDVPFLPVEGLRRLLEAAPVGSGVDERGRGAADPDPRGAMVVAEGPERVHPLIGLLPRGVGGAALAAARRGESARSFVAPARRVPLPGAWLGNVNRWSDTGGAPTPPQQLLATLPWLEGPARERVLAGEVQRLRQRGVVITPLRPSSSPL